MLFLDEAERKDKDGLLLLQRFDVSVISHPLEFNALNRVLDRLTTRDFWYARIGEEEGDAEIKGDLWRFLLLYCSYGGRTCSSALQAAGKQ